MNSRHLPAGQAMPGGGAGVGTGAGAGTGPMGAGDMMGSTPVQGRGRRPPPSYAPPYHQQVNPMYANYMNPYAHQYYHQMPPHYQNGSMPSGYMHYPAYARSPPSMPQYVPMQGVSVPQQPPYARPPQQSPALSTPYQPPPPPAPLQPQTPNSTHSSQPAPAPPMSPSPSIPPQEVAPPLTPSESVVSEPAKQPAREAFRPPLPWLSRPDLPFPTRTGKSKRRRRVGAASEPGRVTLPAGQEAAAVQDGSEFATSQASTVDDSHAAASAVSSSTPLSTVAQPAGPSTPQPRPDTPATDSLSETAQSKTLPSSTSNAGQPTEAARPTTSASSISATSRPAVPVVPIIPAIPKSSPKDTKTAAAGKPQVDGKQGRVDEAQPPATGAPAPSTVDAQPEAIVVTEGQAGEPAASATAPARAAPKLWTGLFSGAAAAAARASTNGTDGPNTAAGASEEGEGAANPGMVKFSLSNANSQAAALRAYRVGAGEKIAFLEPRGLINTGNMCYMNSVLQVLVFCVPFYDFLDQVSRKAAHSFKSETQLIDAMIMFMREYRVIDAASSVEQLRRRLKNEELEQYGEPFIPEFVYECIRTLPRFASMRRGHQQDAEEFLGFLLQSLDDECTHVMGIANSNGPSHAPSVSSASASDAADATDGWFEVGSKQRAAVTRSSGPNSSSPISRIFGGLLRSELRVPGLKDSITTEPYQPLQLDIGAPHVRNIIDALKGLTTPERLHGDFGSPRGKDVAAQKQVFIETLPPVLILHLKRFQFDAQGNGTVKIWKKVGYPLELEIPREVVSRQKRNTLLAEGAGMPKYKLIAVVYHHGKNASGGHYTVDVRRQDGREWIRLDDTVIRRVRSEDVAEGGEEEEPAREARQEGGGSRDASTNRFGGMNDEDAGEEEGWKQVSAPVGGNKRWSSVVNGASAATSASAQAKSKQTKESIRDNKVAYLLFYQRV